MKYGIHLSTFTRSWEEDIFKYVKKVREIGYDSVEFPLMDSETFDVIKAKKMLKEYNLMSTCGTGMNPVRDISSTDSAIRGKGIAHLKKCIEICNELESDCLGGVLYAPWGKCINRTQAKENIKLSLEALSDMASYAEKSGVVLAIEVLNRYETYFVNTVHEAKNYLKQIKSPNVKIHFDTFHSHIEEKSMYDALMLGGEDIYHVHFCENDRGIPGTGQVNFEEVKRGLLDINYDRFIVIENFVMSDCSQGNDVYIWRNIEESGLKAAQEGLTFMKKLFEEEGHYERDRS